MMWWLIPAAIGAVVAMDHDDRLNAIEWERRQERNLANAPKMVGKRVRCEIDSYDDMDTGWGQHCCCPACSTSLVFRQTEEIVHADAGKVYSCCECKSRFAVVKTDEWAQPQEVVFKVLAPKPKVKT